jgi:hypothetical protein
VDLTRWRADTTRDHWGSFVICAMEERAYVSAAFHPFSENDGGFAVTFGPDRVEWTRRTSGLDCA